MIDWTGKSVCRFLISPVDFLRRIVAIRRKGSDSPRLEKEIESWNEDIMMEAMTGENILNENDKWVPIPNDDLDFFPDEEEEGGHDDDWGNDTARDCTGWENGMLKNGKFF